jgi:hypothetical protein
MPHRNCLLGLAALGLVLCLASTPLLAEEAEEGFTSIFDGKTLEGWDGDPKLWSVEEGALTGQTTADDPIPHNSFLIYRKDEPGDFELRFKFRMVGGNSGVQFRSVEVDKWVISGYQGDFDSTNRYTGILYEEKGRGILAKRGLRTTINEDGSKTVTGKTVDEKTIVDSYKNEDWNDFTVIAKGNRITEILNGNVTVEVTDRQEEKRRMKGLIAFQVHRGPPMKIQFKDVRIKKLDEGS